MYTNNSVSMAIASKYGRLSCAKIAPVIEELVVEAEIGRNMKAVNLTRPDQEGWGGMGWDGMG